MKFETITITNFLAITSAEIWLADRGLTLIEGRNLDDTSAESNGSGKSTIADALSWVLFGVTAREESGDGVINDKAGKGCIVTVSLRDGPDAYVIRRHRKHKTGKSAVHLFQVDAKGNETDLTAGTDKLTQEKITKILGCSYDVFVSSVYAAQEKMPDLPAMTDKNLKVLVEEAAGVTLLEDAYEEARLRLRAAEAEMTKTANELATIDSGLANATNQLDAAKVDAKTWDANHKSRIQAAMTTAKQVAAGRDTVKAAFENIDYGAIVNAIATEQTKIDGVKGEQTELAKREQAVSKAEAELASHKRGMDTAKKAFDRHRAELTNVQHKVGCDCTECGREITEAEIESTKTAIMKKVKDARTEYEAAQKAAKTAQASVEQLTGERDTFKGKMTDLSTSIASIRRSEGEKADADAKKRAFESAKAETERAVAEARRIGGESNPIKATIERLEKQVETFTDNRTKALETVDRMEKKLSIAESVSKVFSPAGVRAHILDEVTPFLNGQTAKYLGTLSDGNITATWTTLVMNAKKELKEKFSIEVENAKGAKSFKGLSGGEKRKVRVAAALALQDLVARRATKPIELFIGDEIDDALDAAGRERLTMILEEKAKDRGTVLLISHGEMKDWISQQIRVTKQVGGDTVIDELVS